MIIDIPYRVINVEIMCNQPVQKNLALDRKDIYKKVPTD